MDGQLSKPFKLSKPQPNLNRTQLSYRGITMNDTRTFSNNYYLKSLYELRLGAIFSLISGHFEKWFIQVPTGFAWVLQLELDLLEGLCFELKKKKIPNKTKANSKLNQKTTTKRCISSLFILLHLQKLCMIFI